MTNRKKIIQLIKRFLFHSAIGKYIATSIGFNRNFKKNFQKIKFQGEFFQDMIAYMYLSNIKNGFYIDIGANDGIMNSNTYIFEKLGWKGICVEPQQDIFEKYLKKSRNCDCYNVAISSQSSENVDFFHFLDSNAFSGLDIKVAEEHKKEYSNVEVIKVKTIVFDDLMKNYPNIKTIDFISIDVEGYEIEILKTIDFRKYKFRLLTIENNDPEKIKEILENNGYKEFMKIGVDIMFIPNNNNILYQK